MCGVFSDGAAGERKKVISLIDKAKRSVTYWLTGNSYKNIDFKAKNVYNIIKRYRILGGDL